MDPEAHPVETKYGREVTLHRGLFDGERHRLRMFPGLPLREPDAVILPGREHGHVYRRRPDGDYEFESSYKLPG